ncbi:hypothetical protein M5K25_013829 [Dendrobium thyrsiflorum]|uniref:Uncharacterized protein n=1 Tax=Dendrobium thyrsiflorum TaxID=117978 RepID=A0ABD0V180_DENTH
MSTLKTATPNLFTAGWNAAHTRRSFKLRLTGPRNTTGILLRRRLSQAKRTGLPVLVLLLIISSSF